MSAATHNGWVDILSPSRTGSTSALRVVEVEFVNAIAVWLRGLPMLVRWAIAGAACAAVVGGIAGLVIGLRVYAPTAAFAVVELGFPAGIAGGVVGLAAGVIVKAGRRLTRHDERSP